MDATLTDRVTAHVDYVRSLLALMTPTLTRGAVDAVITHGKDTASPAVGRLALIGTATAPRVAMITRLSPTRARVSYLTESAIRHGRTLNAHNSHPLHLDSWPETYRDNARIQWRNTPPEKRALTEDGYAQYQYEWALKTQAVYRAITHCPWVAFTPIRNTVIRRVDLVMVPENGN